MPTQKPSDLRIVSLDDLPDDAVIIAALPDEFVRLDLDVDRLRRAAQPWRQVDQVRETWSAGG